MAYHPPGHEFHKAAWFPEKELIDSGIDENDIDLFKHAWLSSQEKFWDRVRHLEQVTISDAETGESISDEGHPGSIGIPNYVGLPTPFIKLNDLLRLRECRVTQ